MDLSRPPEPFHRVYSSPESPSTVRRSTLVGVLTAVIVFFAAAYLAVVLGLDLGGSDDDSDQVVGSSLQAPPGSGAAPPLRSAQTFTMLPPPCETVGRSTVDRLVPQATIEQSANTTLAICAYASDKPDPRRLRVETRIFDPLDGTRPIEAADVFFDAQWTRAQEDQVAWTFSLRRYDGLGDEAYCRYKVDKGQPTTVGEVAVRFRNVVITVGYSEEAPGDPGDDDTVNERKHLTEATGIAKEVLDAFK